ncbi:unnamed protein product [Cochlearia groenlandica]
MRTGRGRTMRRRKTEEDDGEWRMRLKKTTRRGRMEDIRRQGENDGGEERWRRRATEERRRNSESEIRQSAEEAIGNLNETFIGKNTVRLSWEEAQTNRGDSGNQWNGGYSSRGQGYNNGYANSQDPNMYATEAAVVPGAS